MPPAHRLLVPLLFLLPASTLHAAPRQVSGIYPHLAMFNDEDECGTGAVVPWAGKLWAVTYAPHKPSGSTDKLYSISPDLVQTIHPESIGGTVANRMIHRESGQLFIGPHVIDAQGTVRTIPYRAMFGRHTGIARHLLQPAEKVVFATMEEGFYEVDVHSLAVHELWADEQKSAGRRANLPGYHGKGFYSAQGRYVYANNGDHAAEALRNPAVPSGALAEWDGKADRWTVVRRCQFTEVTGPGGIEGSGPDAPLWSIGWDHRSLILLLLDGGKWRSFRLPKSSHSYDGAHGWNTEWPRIREIGDGDLLMTMHGAFWRFPRTFSVRNTAGIAPRSNYLKVIGDFCHWNGRVVLGCDDTAKSEFLNEHVLKGKLAGPGQSQSNLVFLKSDQIDHLGPVVGRGAVWLDDSVEAEAVSEPFLFNGFAWKSLHLACRESTGAPPVAMALEIDARGDGNWKPLREIRFSGGSHWEDLSGDHGQWIRLRSPAAHSGLTAMFHFRAKEERTEDAADIFNGLGTGETTRGVLLARGGGLRTLRFVSDGQAYDLDGELTLRPANDPEGAAWTAANAAIPEHRIGSDAASVFFRDARGIRWRLPKGVTTDGARVCREVCTERNLLNAGGTFYEMPAENAGGFAKIRPVATHNRAIWDYASYRGLLVMSGVSAHAQGEHIIRSADGRVALWAGSVDDLWQLGKPRGTGGPWKNTAVAAGQPSDPYLCTGYDRKRLVLTSDQPVTVRIEADFTGNGQWSPCASVEVPPAAETTHRFPDAFGAYWLRLVCNRPATVTALFHYW
ncbi:MAG: hypothetical protein KA004_16820 [Verrucomicrobiales bacterium]|nr:hypothetical protein [Verrucomicrobiales bacterium]